MNLESNYAKILVVTVFLVVALSHDPQAVQASLDEDLFRLINQEWKSPALDQPMLYMTHAGDGLPQALAAGGFYLAGEEETSLLLLSSLTKTWWVAQSMKAIVQRPRPGLVYDDVEFIGNYRIADRRSFPSGHTTGSFAVATVLSHQYPQYTPYFYTYSSLVGISRVYTGVHHPSDVVVGAVLGYLIGKSTIRHKGLIVNGNFLVYSFAF